jgi:hypothetical protein
MKQAKLPGISAPPWIKITLCPNRVLCSPRLQSRIKDAGLKARRYKNKNRQNACATCNNARRNAHLVIRTK